MAFTCPVCHRTSYHPQDEAEGYCGACHDFTGILPGMRIVEDPAVPEGEIRLVYGPTGQSVGRIISVEADDNGIAVTAQLDPPEADRLGLPDRGPWSLGHPDMETGTGAPTP